MHCGARNLFVGLGQSQTGCVLAGDPTDQWLQRAGAAELLQISDEREVAVGRAAPAQVAALRQPNPESHGLLVSRKTLQVPPPFRHQTKIIQSC